MANRLSIEVMQEYATDKGGKCLSTEYISVESPLAWRCKIGHTWDASFRLIQMGAWCVQCNKNSRKEDRLEAMKAIAIERGGKCLAVEYFNKDTAILFECSKGHQWKGRPGNIQQGAWCHVCAGNLKLTIEDMVAFAEKHNGKCLSEKYTNSETKLKWQCAEGHIWEAVPKGLTNNHWCRICSMASAGLKRRKTIEEIRELATKKGGKLISDVYLGNHIPIKWQCSKGHNWKASPANIKSGFWCPHCAGLAKHTIEEMRELAAKRGGKCLSTVYKNIEFKLQWECAKGHVWMSSPHYIYRNGMFCPECFSRKGLRNKKNR
jgi:hypothetical protein